MGCSAASILNTRHSQLKGVPIGFRIHRKVASGAHPGTVGDLEGTFSPVPTPRGDSRHGPLHEVNPGKSRVLVIPPGNPTSEPLPGTAFPRVSPRTAPAPWGGEEAGGRAGWGFREGLTGVPTYGVQVSPCWEGKPSPLLRVCVYARRKNQNPSPTPTRPAGPRPGWPPQPPPGRPGSGG